jgi:hypothetical protein
MATSKFFFLDSAGLDKDFFLNKDLDSTILSNNIFNTSLNNLQVQIVFEQHQKAIYELVKEDQFFTFKNLSYIVESFMIQLLSISSISNLEKTKLSSHYSKYKQVTLKHLCKSISSEYLEDLTFTNSRVWGGEYGTPLYYLYLDNIKQHYLHPSQLTEIVINSISKSSVSTFSNTYSQLASLALSDDLSVDELIYKVPINVLNTTVDIKTCGSLLTFFSKWLPKLLNWYLEPFLSQNVKREITTDAEKDLETIAQKCLYYGLDFSSFSEDLFFNFIHQNLSSSFFSLFEDIISFRKSISDKSKEKSNPLLTEFIEAIPLNTSSSLIRETSLTLLRELCPPGGYNLLLILTSLILLNRAFILLHPTNNPYSNLNIFPLDTPFDPVLNLIGRVLRLIYIAGFNLTKSNLEHLNITGFNLMQLTNLDSNPVISTKDLTT